jgi:hypothetical protein
MERANKSKSYEVLTDHILKLKEQHDIHLFWEHQYISRYVHQYHLGEVDRLLDSLEQILDKYLTVSGTSMSSQDILHVTYALIYAWHRAYVDVAFRDFRFEKELPVLDTIIQKLTPDERSTIERLHELSYEFGFLILELCLPLGNMKEVVYFLSDRNYEKSFQLQIPKFSFLRKENSLEGVQISYEPTSPPVDNDYDLIIYYSPNVNLHQIRTALNEIWMFQDEQVIGNRQDAFLAFYVQRQVVKSRKHLLDIVELQIEHYFMYASKELLALFGTPDMEDSPFKKEVKDHKKALAVAIDRFRVLDKSINKRWDPHKENIRRAIVLLLWDQKVIVGTKKTTTSLVEELLDQLPNSIFEAYHENFNTKYDIETGTMFRDQASVRDTVIREALRDFNLTDRCITDTTLYYHRTGHRAEDSVL